MLLQVGEFRDRVKNDMDRLVNELQFVTSRRTESEESAWRASLPKVAKVFSDPSFEKIHMFFSGPGNLALEYRIPGGNNWADLVLIGRTEKSPSAVVVELKNWVTRGDVPGPGEGLIYRNHRNEQHPSRQVEGYVEACRKFHSAIQDRKAEVNGCVLFTRDPFYHSYKLPPNNNLFEKYPCFGLDPDDVKAHFPRFIAQFLTSPDHDFATDFVRGTYRQSRSFVSLVGDQILKSNSRPLVLLDGQQLAFDLVCARVRDAVLPKKNRKRVIIVKGPPGSGKSAVAAKVWATLVTDETTSKGDIVIATTSASQYTNWEHIIEKGSELRGSGNIIKKASSYTPLTTGEFGKLRKKYPTAFTNDADKWLENMKMARSLVPFKKDAEDDQILVSLVDEAHALINPEHNDGRGQFGFVVALGPQAYQIMRASVVTVFLMDPRQGFRQHENTTIEEIKKWADMLGAESVEEVSLEDCQFRCAGSKQFVDQIDSLLDGKCLSGRHDMEVLFFENPVALEESLQKKVVEGNNCRLVASYAREWKTKGIALPHSLPANMKDFCHIFEWKGKKIEWAKIWNYAPDADYTLFVQGTVGSEISTNPLAEIGCPYVVRNFDFDYVGLIWLSDLVWRTDRWIVNLSNVWETGISRIKSRAAKNLQSQDYLDILEAVKSAYRILLTRAIKGIFIWCEDPETEAFLRKNLV